MNKKVILPIMLFLASVLMISFPLASAQNLLDCELAASLINQDPYPAVPGDQVKVVFQLDGVDNPNCGTVSFTLLEEFPFSLDPGIDPTVTIKGGTHIGSDFRSFLLAPYKLRVDEAALDDENQIKVQFTAEGLAGKQQDFNITVENLKTDFEVTIKDYVPGTNTLTFEILNTGESDIEALTIDVPKQQTLAIKGSSRNIVGSLDSNEDTTFNFEAVPQEGEITLEILYTDEINVRRALEKTVTFDPVYFTDRARDQNGGSTTIYIIIAAVVLVIIFWIVRARRKRKKKQRG